MSEAGNALLLCEFSHHHICIALRDNHSHQWHLLSYYELKNGLAPDTLSDVMLAESIDLNRFHHVWLSSALKEVLLVPENHFTEENARTFFITTYGNTTDLLFFDAIKNQNLVLVHAVPETILQQVKTSAEIKPVHSSTCQLRSGKREDELDEITVHFTSREIQVVAKKEGHVKLVQYYFYSTPLDVVYYLLAICQKYDLSQSQTTVILSGLISEDSAMYKELYQYFAALHFWQLPAKETLPGEYPPHFFSSMYNLASCAL